MNRLKALDAGFLYTETARMPMHIGSVQILEVPSHRSATFFSELKPYIRSRSHLLPYMTHRVVNAPLQIDHPRWASCEPDYDAHIERITLPPPGDMPQLERAVAALHALPLDRARPLWKIYYFDGLRAERAAYFNVVHHACLDGLAGQTAVEVLTDAAPDALDVRRESASVAPRESRDAAELIAETARRIDAMARLGRRWLAPGGSALGALAPNTPINRAIGAARSYAMLRISMTDVKAIGKASGCSINDVFLTICGGALRPYLLRRGALPAASLIAGVPVSVRAPGDRTMNTQVTMTRVALATTIDDPVERLAAVHVSSVAAKAVAQDASALLPADLRVFGAPWIGRAASSLWELSGAASYLPPLVNLVISNVPGPRSIRYSNGARVSTHFPVSIPAHGAALNITVQSYAEHFDIGITACERTVPDVALLRDDLLRAYIDLRARVLHRHVDIRTLQPNVRETGIERRCLSGELKVA
jgi:WS/DGAT/MGAT family acyltransferase